MASGKRILLNDETAAPMPVSSLLRRLGALAASHWREALVAVAVTVGAQLATLGGVVAQGLAIDTLRLRAAGADREPAWPAWLGGAPASWSLTQALLILGGVILAFSLLTAVARYAQRVADERFVQACVVDLRTKLYEKLQRLSFSFFDAHDTGEIIQRVTSDAQSVRAFIQGVMIRLLIAVVTFGVFLTYMLRESVTLALVCLITLPLQTIVMTRFGRLAKPAYIRQGRLVDEYVHHFQESIAGARVIRSFAREPERIAQADERVGAARDHRVSIDRLRSTHIPVVMGSSIVSQAVLLGVGGGLVLMGPGAGGIELGALWVFYVLVGRLGAQALSEAIAMVAASAPESLAGAERVFRLMDYPEEVGPGSAPAPAPASGGARGRVEFRGVTFSYGGAEPSLRGVSFVAEPGETIAIVGPTGSGKSTLLGLIPRFYDADEGEVVVDGVDVRALPLREHRARVGFVFQEPFLFSNTIRRNVAFGASGASEPEVLAAIEDAHASDVLAERESGLETIIGERGVSLSGGQRQRLTLARALLTDPEILVLDDATGAVDAITESEILRALDRRTRGRTTFIVAHRLSTLRRADRIVVLDRGRVVDVGTHAELLERPGHYRAAALIQLALDDDEGGDREGAA